ncbi:ABC transporter substrate-binding protein [Gorillibacterium sp. sgz5001074]|uniref:ABC transporter substrate-binding protein n=1 Tax=Gorillibacterium sp. sgz5001074 TaxID=3446695 RepID=UPI003F67B867
MRKTWKPFLLATTACVLMLGAAGCEGQTDSASSADAVKLKFIWWGSPQRKELTLKVIDLYQKAHPNVKIETEDYANATAVATQLALETADQTTADIIQGDYSFIFNYINKDLIEPLNPYTKNKILDISDMDPAYLQPGSKDGQQYAIPMGTNALAIAYDPALFDRAGVPPLANGYTFDELYATLKKLKEKINTPDFYPLDNAIDVSYWLRTKGESLYNRGGTGLGYSDPSMVEYMSTVKRWTGEKLLNPKVDVSPPTIGANNSLVLGKTALFPTTSNQVVALGNMAGRSIKLLNLPTYSGAKEGNFVKPSQFLAASAYSKHPEEAVKFISFFINSPEANDILNGERGVPIPAKISDRLMQKADVQAKEQYTHMAYVAKHSSPIDPPAPKQAGIVSNLLQLKLNDLISGALSPEEAARSFRQEAEKLFDQGGTGK